MPFQYSGSHIQVYCPYSQEGIFSIRFVSDMNYVEFCITHESVNPWRPFHIPPFITLNGGKKRQFMDKLGNLVNPFSQISSLSFDAAAIGKKGFKMENPSVWTLLLSLSLRLPFGLWLCAPLMNGLSTASGASRGTSTYI